MKRSAIGAIAAQGVQALASFLLQVIVARTLGYEGLGVFAILYGVVVLASGTTTGFVGDSLVVLPRGERAVRSALEQFSLIVAGGAGLVSAVVTTAIGLTTPLEGVLFGIAIVAFCLEEVVRRTLMADLRFWRVSAIDGAGLVVAMGVIGLGVLVGHPALSTFLSALAAGQTTALLIGCFILPANERFLVPFVGGARSRVAAYGIWRSLQQFLRPALLTVVRSVVGITAGFAATGLLEAGRVYVAPALLLVSGLSSYLFASFARQRDRPLRERLRRSDRAVAALVVVTAVIGVVAVVALPVAGPLLFKTAPDLIAVIGWLAYTASVAAVTPYGALAAVSGRQAVVFAVRVGDTLVSLLAVVIALPLGVPAAWAPAFLAIGSLAGGLVLRALTSREPAAPPEAGAAAEVEVFDSPAFGPGDADLLDAPVTDPTAASGPFSMRYRWLAAAAVALVVAAVVTAFAIHPWQRTAPDPSSSPSSTAAPISVDDLRAVVAAAPAGSLIPLKSGTYVLHDFDAQLRGVDLGTSGLEGAGMDATTIEIAPHSSTKAASVPTAPLTTNPLYLVWTVGGTPGLSGFTLRATGQGHLYGGIFLGHATGAHVTDVRIEGVPGGASEPPGETFALNDFRSTGSVYDRITIDGAQVSAAGFGTNNSTDVTVNDSTFTHTRYSSGAAMWQTQNITMNDVKIVDNRSGMNFERDSGQITLNRPTFRNNSLYDMQFGTDGPGADVVINDPVLAAGQRIRLNVPALYHGAVNGQLRSNIHVVVGGVDRTADLVQYR